MILVGQYNSPFVRRVGITLHLYGLPFTRNAISVFGDKEAMARINPLVRIPSLVLDDGTTLIDSAAILDALDEMVGPRRALTPPSGLARQRVVQATAMAVGTGEKAGAWAYERHFHQPGCRNVEMLARYESQISGGLAWLEERVQEGHLCGPALTQADVTAGAVIGYLKLRVQQAFSSERYPRLAALSQSLEATEPFIATRPGPNELMPST